jgi:hypothetical protein
LNSCYCPDQGLFIVAQPSSASIAQCDLIEVLATPIVSRLVLIKVPIHLADCRGVVAVDDVDVQFNLECGWDVRTLCYGSARNI